MLKARSRRVISAPLINQDAPATDLTRVPWLGRFLRWRHARTALQVPALLVALAMVLHGLFGPSLAPKNLATVLGWVHVRGALVLTLLVAGNFFCMACPFMLPRDLARRLFAPTRNWPRPLRNKWLSIALFALILFLYELFDLWSDPQGTALLILAYFAGALVVDSIFRHASFCKFVCPIGQFNFVASTISPLEVKVRDREVCDTCRTKDCIRGRREARPETSSSRRQLVVLQRGCELALFQPSKVGNLDCTFCLDCVHACPHDNVGIITRLPGEELMTDPSRSGIGHLSRRVDMASLTAVFAFGALLNAFAMVSPIYAIESWLASIMRVEHEAPVLAVLFAVALVVEPVLVLGLAGWLTRRLTASRDAVLPVTVRYAYSLAPLGFGVWLAHYSFHFLAGLWTFVPVAQSAAAELVGSPVLGVPLWRMVGMPAASVYPIELGFLALGLLGSLLVAYRLAEKNAPERLWGAFAPWATLALLMWLSAMWLLAQPMEMRGTILAS